MTEKLMTEAVTSNDIEQIKHLNTKIQEVL